MNLTDSYIIDYSDRWIRREIKRIVKNYFDISSTGYKVEVSRNCLVPSELVMNNGWVLGFSWSNTGTVCLKSIQDPYGKTFSVFNGVLNDRLFWKLTHIGRLLNKIINENCKDSTEKELAVGKEALKYYKY